MIDLGSMKKADFKRLTQHERVVLLRTIRMHIPLEIYIRKYHVRNIPHLIG